MRYQLRWVLKAADKQRLEGEARWDLRSEEESVGEKSP